MTSAFLFFLLAIAAFAQAQPETATNTGSIAGVVREAANGAAVADATIYLDRNSRTGSEVKADAQGRYSILNVSPGQHRLTAEAPRVNTTSFPTYASRLVNIAAGQEVTALNFALTTLGEISGKVVDQNKEPVPNISVMHVAREYSLGALRYVFASIATTDDQGQYVIRNVKPGRAYLLMAQKRTFKLDAISNAPADSKLRKPAVVTTFYPGAASVEGAQPVILRPGERREGVDLRVLRSPSYCAQGVVQGGSGPQPLMFTIADRQPTSGAHGDGASFISPPSGRTAADGKIRVCNLHPGEYTLTAYSEDSTLPQFYGSAELTIVDRDVFNVTVPAKPLVAIAGEVAWAGEPADPPVTEQISVSMRPMTRAPWRGELSGAKASIPGQFSFPSVLTDSYSIQVLGLPKDVYIKEISYAGQNVQAEPLRVGSGIGEATLRVILARDGGTIAARVADKDSNVVPDARVLVLPVTVASEAALAAAIVTGQCDQNGAWTSNRIAPGKYYVVALATPHDNSPESISKLWGSRTQFKEVEVAPKANVQVTLPPTSLN